MSAQLTTRRNKRKLVILVSAAILLTGLAWYVNNQISLAELAEQEDRVRAYIALNPWRSFIVGFGIYAGLSLVPGTGGKAIVYGWLFGFWQAVTIVTVGLTLAAMTIFSLSRYLFRESIERRYANPVALMNKHLELEGAFYLLALRMAHAPLFDRQPDQWGEPCSNLDLLLDHCDRHAARQCYLGLRGSSSALAA